jgi:hypothetical protein
MGSSTVRLCVDCDDVDASRLCSACLSERAAGALIDVEYAIDQLHRHGDRWRALDALYRARERLIRPREE